MLESGKHAHTMSEHIETRPSSPNPMVPRMVGRSLGQYEHRRHRHIVPRRWSFFLKLVGFARPRWLKVSEFDPAAAGGIAPAALIFEHALALLGQHWGRQPCFRPDSGALGCRNVFGRVGSCESLDPTQSLLLVHAHNRLHHPDISRLSRLSPNLGC